MKDNKNYLNKCYFEQVRKFPYTYKVTEPYGSILVTIPKVTDMLEFANTKGKIKFFIEDIVCSFDTDALIDKARKDGSLKISINKRKDVSEYGHTHYAIILDSETKNTSSNTIITGGKEDGLPF